MAPIATSKGVCGSALKKPATTLRVGSAKNGAVMCSSQSAGRRVPASVAAITSPLAALMAMLRPSEMLQPGCSSTFRGSRSVKLRRVLTVLSLEPPSTITISSGWRVWAAKDSSTPRIESPSLKTVMIREMVGGEGWVIRVFFFFLRVDTAELYRFQGGR